MKFSIVPVALLAAFAASGAIAQDSSVASSSSVPASSVSSSSSAAPTSMASSSAASGGSAAVSVCDPLGGDPRNRPAGCPYSSTTTPPYNREYLFIAVLQQRLVWPGPLLGRRKSRLVGDETAWSC